MIPIVTVWPDAERVADREHDVADLHRVGVAERERMQIGGGDFEQREIARLVGADDLRRQRAAVGHLDLDVVRAVHHVVVGQDVAVGRDDDAGPERRAGAARLLALAATELIAELLAEESAQHVVVALDSNSVG